MSECEEIDVQKNVAASIVKINNNQVHYEVG